MLINLRNALMTGKHKPTAKDYVQDGLLLMFDGIENAGFGQHDASLQGWKDLGPFGLFPSFTVGTQGANNTYWKSDALVVVKYYYSPRTIALGDDVYSAMTTALLNGTFTMEYCFIDGGNTSYASGGGYQCVSPISPFLGVSDFIGCRIDRFMVNPFRSGYGYYFAVQIVRNGIQNGGTYSFVINSKPTDYKIGVQLAFNGQTTSGYIPKGTETNAGTWANRVTTALTTKSFGMFGNRNNIGGSLHSLRFYSKSLSAQEVAANYAVDKARFGLP